MKDIKIDKNFEIVLDHRNDLATVEEREEFEQNLALGVTRFFFEEIGSVDRQSAKARLRIHSERLINQYGRGGQIERVSIEKHEELSNTLEVSLVYLEGDEFSFIID